MPFSFFLKKEKMDPAHRLVLHNLFSELFWNRMVVQAHHDKRIAFRALLDAIQFRQAISNYIKNNIDDRYQDLLNKKMEVATETRELFEDCYVVDQKANSVLLVKFICFKKKTFLFC